MEENKALYKLIKDIGTELGLHFDDGKKSVGKSYEAIDKSSLTQPVVFTNKPVDYYFRRRYSSWSTIRIEPIISAEVGWVELVFLAYISLPISDSYDPDVTTEALNELSYSLHLFNTTCPAEAATLFELPMELEMSVWGEVIFDSTGNDEWPALDLSNTIDLKLHIGVYETEDEEEFNAAFDTLAPKSPICDAIRNRMKAVTRLFRHFQTEGDSQSLGIDITGTLERSPAIFVSPPQDDGKKFVQ